MKDVYFLKKFMIEFRSATSKKHFLLLKIQMKMNKYDAITVNVFKNDKI